MNLETRERTFTWKSPAETASRIFHRNHLEWLRDMMTGKIPPPPAAHLMGFTMEAVEDGRVTFAMAVEEWMSNPTGVLHGGLTSTLLDTVLTLAVTTKLPTDRFCTTADLHVHFVRPVFPTGARLVAEGVAVHVGKTMATAEARAHDEAGKLIAHATATLAIVDAPSG